MDITALLLFALASAITPGPNNVMIMSSGTNFGIKRSLPHYFGIVIGFTIMMLAVGFGLGALFSKYAILHATIKFLGAAYMLYLAWKIANSHKRIETKTAAKPFTFIQAALFQWVNPKAWVMIVSAFAAFTVSHAQLDIWLQILIIVGLFSICTFVAVATWMYCGVKIRHFLKSDKHHRWFNYSIAALLTIAIAMIFVE